MVEKKKGGKPSLKKQLEENSNQLLRLQAEFENFRKRTQKEKEQLLKFGARNFVLKMVDLLDTFELALQVAKQSNNKDLVQGLEMTHNNFKKALEEEGVKPIETIGKSFDHDIHDAIKEEKSKEKQGTILKEVQKGYYYHELVLRPSKVIVAGGN